MGSFNKTAGRIFKNPIVRNVVLGVCLVVLVVFLTSILLNVFTRHNRSNEVPDLSGLTMEQALQASRGGSLRIEVNDSLYVPAYEGGIILDQLPKPGTKVKSGRRVFVTVNSYRQKMVRIPYVKGFSLRQAKNNLEVAGLEIDRLVFKPDMASNYVLDQQFEGKPIARGSTLEAEQGSGVTLVVGMSSDEPLPYTPKLIGFPLSEAKSRIWEAGLNVGKVEFDEGITLLNRNEAKVYVQSPQHGKRVSPGTDVDVKLSLDADKVEDGSAASDKAAKRIIPAEQAKAREEEAARQQQQQEAAEEEGENDAEAEEE